MRVLTGFLSLCSRPGEIWLRTVREKERLR